MVVGETNTVFPLITTHARISALPQIAAHYQGRNDKYADPPISAPTSLPPHYLKQKLVGMPKRNLLTLPLY